MKIKHYLKILPYWIIVIALAMVSLWGLTYLQYYVHELGHANSALIKTMILHENTININFTYINYPIFFTNHTLKVPQQTIAPIPKMMFIYGFLFTTIFYALIFMAIVFIISKIERFKENKRIGLALTATLILLVVNDFISNLLCGTDGLNLSCSSIFINLLGKLISFLFLVALGWFYMEILFLNKILK